MKFSAQLLVATVAVALIGPHLVQAVPVPPLVPGLSEELGQGVGGQASRTGFLSTWKGKIFGTKDADGLRTGGYMSRFRRGGTPPPNTAALHAEGGVNPPLRPVGSEGLSGLGTNPAGVRDPSFIRWARNRSAAQGKPLRPQYEVAPLKPGFSHVAAASHATKASFREFRNTFSQAHSTYRAGVKKPTEGLEEGAGASFAQGGAAGRGTGYYYGHGSP